MDKIKRLTRIVENAHSIISRNSSIGGWYCDDISRDEAEEILKDAEQIILDEKLLVQKEKSDT